MSDYGLKIFDASGNTILDVADMITRLRYSNEVAAGVSSNVTLTDTDGKNSCEFSMGINTVWDNACHQFSRSGTTFTWAASGQYFVWTGGETQVTTDSILFVFLYS